MDVSIIIVSYNTKRLTLQCIDSVVSSIKKLRYEIIVVDNGSNDNSVIEISELKSQISNIRLITNNKNLGFSKANNQGIRTAKGEYILLLNSDTEVKKTAIEKMVGFAKKTSDAGVVGPRLLDSDGSVQSSVFRFPTISRAIQQYFFGKKSLLDKYSPVTNHQSPITIDAVVGAAFLITPTALKKVGLLDERFFMYYEDIDYCRRIWKSGLKVYYLQTAEVIHLHGASASKNESGSYKLLVESSKNYHGRVKHYIINFIIWSGQKWQRLHK